MAIKPSCTPSYLSAPPFDTTCGHAKPLASPSVQQPSNTTLSSRILYANSDIYLCGNPNRRNRKRKRHKDDLFVRIESVSTELAICVFAASCREFSLIVMFHLYRSICLLFPAPRHTTATSTISQAVPQEHLLEHSTIIASRSAN